MTSPTSSKEQPININITKPGVIGEVDKYSCFREYIIVNNLDLQQQVKDLTNEVYKLKTIIDEKEDEEDKYDTRTRYLRSLLTNLNELKKGHFEISNNRKDLVNKINNMWNEMYSKQYNYIIKQMCLLITGLFINKIPKLLLPKALIINNPYFEHILYLTINICMIYQIVQSYLDYTQLFNDCKNRVKNKCEEVLNSNKEKEKELAKLEESTLSLENWIYEV